MADYIITFTGHIIEKHRPDGFPKDVHVDVAVRVEDLNGLRKMTDNQYGIIIRNQGMFVYLDPFNIDERSFKPDTQIFVPLSSISHISTKTKKLASEFPADDAAVQ